MCKLCNTSTEPRDSSLMTSVQVIEFFNITNDYTGENPCQLCYASFVSRVNSTRLNQVNIEQYIIKKLKNRYIGKVFNKNEIARARARMVGCRGGKAVSRIIYKSTYNETGTEAFRVANANVNKTFKTLEEAIAFRDKHCPEYVNRGTSSVVSKTIEKGIRSCTNSYTGNVSFNFRHNKHSKSFSTLTEAQEYKKDYARKTR